MGLSPQEVLGLSVFEFLSALDGFAQANDPEGEKALSESEKNDLWTFIQDA
jgi:hypothetical protein